MLVEQCMSRKVVTVAAESTVAEVQRVMERHGFRHLPVVEGRKLVGIISDRDLLSPPKGAVTAAELMTSSPVVVAPQAAVDEGAQLMRSRRIDALPVVDKNQLIGILTSSDILDAFVELSGVSGATTLMMLRARDGANAEARIQEVAAGHRARVKWLHCDTEHSPVRIQVRLAGPHVADIATALEAAGFEVIGMVSGARSKTVTR